MSSPKLPLFVLIHGAWQGSWAFAAWLPELRRYGCTALAVDLPGNGWPPAPQALATLDTYTAHVVKILEELDQPVILVGHSGGGITASQVAELMPERVAAVVYLAGIMLPSGQGFDEIIAQCERESPGAQLNAIAPYLEFSADGTVSNVREQGALTCFVQDCDPVAALHAARLLRPQQLGGLAMKPALTAARFGRVLRVYVECTQDCSVLPPLQRKMQELTPGAVRITLDCGHVPQLAQPARLTELLLGTLQELLFPSHPE